MRQAGAKIGINQILPPEKMRRLRFDKAAHSYHLDDKPTLSVTQVLDKSGLINKDWFTEDARARGVAVHDACHLENLGTLDWDSLHPEVLPRVEAWKAFKRDFGFEVMLSEATVYEPDFQIVGMLDDFGWSSVKSKHILVDIKSGPVQQWAAYQTAGYALAVKYLTGILPSRYAIHLRADGKYRLHAFNDFRDFNMFVSMLHNARRGVTIS